MKTLLVANQGTHWATTKKKNKQKEKVSEVYFIRMSSTIKRRSVKYSGFESAAKIRNEPIIMGEIYRIIMSDGFQHFAGVQ